MVCFSLFKLYLAVLILLWRLYWRGLYIYLCMCDKRCQKFHQKCLTKMWTKTVTLIKFQSVSQPRLAPLVPSRCLPIFAKRSWWFWAQELENVWLVQCLKCQTFSDSCAHNHHDLLAKIVQHIDGTYCGELCCSRQEALVLNCFL